MVTTIEIWGVLYFIFKYWNNRDSIFHISVCHFERSFINNPGPCVLFATPGMISGGFSLEAFKKWAPSEKNLITLPGYTPYLFVYSIFSNLLNHSYSYRQALPNLLFYSYSDAAFLFFPHRYCVSGTIGHKLMCGKPTRIDYKDTHIDVRCQVDFYLISYFAKNWYKFK